MTLPVQGQASATSAARLQPTAGGNPALDRLAELAARLLGASASQVSLLTDVQLVAGGAGLPAGSIGSRSPLADSLCTVTARANAPLVVPDAAADPRVQTLPPVTSGAVGACLGVPPGRRGRADRRCALRLHPRRHDRGRQPT